MVTGRARIDSLEAGQAHLADGADASGTELVVPVRTVVPAWLADLAALAAVTGSTVVVEAEPPAANAAVHTPISQPSSASSTRSAGAADVLGIDPGRVARVQEVDVLLAAHAPSPVAPEAAS